MTSTLHPAEEESVLQAALSASPLSPPSQDKDDLRAELSAYLTSLKASSTVTLPADFDTRVDCIACASLTDASSEQPAWMSIELSWQPAEEEKAQETSAAAAAAAAATAGSSDAAVIAAGVTGGAASWLDADALSDAGVEGEESGSDWAAAACASPLLAELESLSAGLQYSEEEEMRKIAELDELLQRITSTAEATAAEETASVSPPLPLSSTAAGAISIHQEEGDGAEQDLTFITSISAREQQPQLKREEEKEAITMPVMPASAQRPQHRQNEESFALEAEESTAGSGFCLSREETARLGQIDALLSALHAEEKAGKRRRFMLRVNSRQGGSWVEKAKQGDGDMQDADGKASRRAGKGKDRKEGERKEHKLPPLSASVAPAASASSSSSVSQYVESLSSLLDDCLSASELQRLADIDARLSDMQPSDLDALTVLDAGQFEDSEARDATAASLPAPSLPQGAAATGKRWSDGQDESLTASSLRECYEREGKLRHRTPARADDSAGTTEEQRAAAAAESDSEDAYSWLDDGLDGDDAQQDERDELDGLLPDSDDEERDAVWQRMRSLPPAPDPREETQEREKKEQEEEEAAVVAEPVARASVEERATAVAAGSEGVRRRVSGLIEEAERRRQWLWSGEATAASDQRQTAVAARAGGARRVRTSDDSGRSRAALHLPSLPGRPASAEQRAAAAAVVRLSKRRTT